MSSTRTPLTYSLAAEPLHVATTWLHSERLEVPPVRSQPTSLPVPLYMRRFQPMAEPRWKKAQPERLPEEMRLETGEWILNWGLLRSYCGLGQVQRDLQVIRRCGDRV